ncbi:hypothetical protein LMH73_013110 [Vibrio splendidus]|nr:hypothetical protein [Vibrio splendidus]MCC4880717.1 hypothetical protein [Vibrio splendidus]
MLDFLLGHWAMDGIISFVLFSVGFLIALSGCMMFSREITKKIIIFASVFGFFYKEINGLIYSLYEPFYQGNPQVSTVLLLILSVVILGVICGIKKMRSIDRVFTFTMVTASTLIWIICHVAMIQQGLLYNVNKTIKNNEIAISSMVKYDNRDAFYEFCEASGMACYWSSDAKPNQKFIDVYEEKAKMSYNVMTQVKYKSEVEVIEGVFVKSAYQIDERSSNAALTMAQNPQTNVIASAFDSDNINEIHEITIVYFYTWFALALVFWLWGGLALLYFHHTRFHKRTEQASTVDQVVESKIAD